MRKERRKKQISYDFVTKSIQNNQISNSQLNRHTKMLGPVKLKKEFVDAYVTKTQLI